MLRNIIGVFMLVLVPCTYAQQCAAFSTLHPTDPYIAAFHINDVLAGAYGHSFTIAADGSVDVTTNLQTAIDTVANVHKGGVLYVPKGKYRVDGTLILREGVTLRGDWSIPTDTPDYANQTVFCVYYGRNGETNTPWMTIDGNAELNGAVIWYPAQTAAGIVPYADTIQMKQVDNRRAASAKCLTFINAYRGIGTVNISMGYMGNIYGTCLKSGGKINGSGGSCQYVNLHFSPKYWEQSGLSDAPSSSGAHRPFMKNGGIGFVNDGAKYGAFLYIDGYDIGYSHNGGRYDYKFVITNCNVGIQFDGEAQGGINMNGYVEAANYALCSTGSPLQSATQIIFQDVVLKGGLKAVYLSKDNHRMDLSFQGCTFSNAVHVMYGKNLSFSACNFSSPSNHIILPSTGPDTILAGNTFTDKAMNMIDGKTNTIVDTQAVVYPVCPEYIDDPFVVTKAGRAAVYAVTNYGATIRWPGDPVNPNDDDAPGIQAAINQANADGGGIVYLPSGIYEIRTPIEIKPNVVVQGSAARTFEGTVFGLFELKCSELDVHYGRGQESLPAAVKLDANSGINGVAFLQPDQDSSQPDPNLPGCSILGYPYIIATAGNNTFIKNICYVTYKGINITNNNCYVEFAGGSPLREGIVVQGGATNCVLRNIQHGNHDDPVDANLPYRESMLNAMTFKHTVGLKVLQHQGHGCNNVVRLENEAADKGPGGLGLLIQMEQGRFEVSGNAGGFQGIGVRINLDNGNNLHTQPEFSDTFNVFGYWGAMGTNYLPMIAHNGTGTLNLIGYIGQNYTGSFIGGVDTPVNGPLNIYTLISKDHTFNMGPAGKLSIVSTIDSDALYGTSLNPEETLYGPVQAGGVIPPSVRLVQRAMHSPVVPLGTNEVIQAEDYLYFYDTTAGNSGGKYRSDDVDIALNARQTNAYHVMVNAANEWLGYDLSGFDSGSYDVKLQVAAATDGQTVELTQNGVLLRTVSIPRTTDAQTYRTVNIPSVSLAGGPGATLYIRFPEGALNFDFILLDMHKQVLNSFSFENMSGLVSGGVTNSVNLSALSPEWHYWAVGAQSGTAISDLSQIGTFTSTSSKVVNTPAFFEWSGTSNVNSYVWARETADITAPGTLDPGEGWQYTVTVGTAGTYDLYTYTFGKRILSSAFYVSIDGLTTNTATALMSGGGGSPAYGTNDVVAKLNFTVTGPATVTVRVTDADGTDGSGDDILAMRAAVLIPVNIITTNQFDIWAHSYGLTGSAASQQADPDGDGANNLYEYALGGNPTNGTDAAAIQPVARMTVAGGTNWLEYVYSRRNDAAVRGLTYALEQRDNLISGSWSNIGTSAETGYGRKNAEFDSVTNRIQVEGKTKSFIRLKITGN